MVRRLLRRVVGLLFLLAGVAKFLSWPESPYALLRAAQAANAGHWIAPLSGIAVALAPVLIPAIGLAMVLSGLGQIFDVGLRAAAGAQFTMMACFVLLLHRAFPAVLLTDGVIAGAILLGTFPPVLGRSASQ